MKWQKSDDGFTKTHCLHYSISPEYWGRVRAQSYRLEFISDIREGVAYSRSVRVGSYATQAAAKQAAEAKEDEKRQKQAFRRDMQDDGI